MTRLGDILKYTATAHVWLMPVFLTSRTARRTANVRHHATVLQVSPHGQIYKHYTRRCLLYIRKRSTGKKKGNLCPFSSASSPDFPSIGILRPLSNTNGGNKNIFVIKVGYSKLTKNIPTAKTTAKITASIFMEQKVVSLRISCKVLKFNGPKFASKFFCRTMPETESQNSSSYRVPHAGQ